MPTATEIISLMVLLNRGTNCWKGNFFLSICVCFFDLHMAKEAYINVSEYRRISATSE